MNENDRTSVADRQVTAGNGRFHGAGNGRFRALRVCARYVRTLEAWKNAHALGFRTCRYLQTDLA